MSDLIIVGGGVIGLSVARDAALRGLSVTVLERGRPGREASWAAAGMLSPLAESPGQGPFLDFALSSLRLYRSWVDRIEEESGIEVEYREAGKLRLAGSDAEREQLEVRRGWARERGLGARWLEADELRREVPGLAPGFQAGLLLEEDYRVDNRLLSQALVASARGAGARITSGVTVEAVESKGDRVTGVRSVDGDVVPGDRVLLAAGAWTGTIGGVDPLPVRPILGQMLSLRNPDDPWDRVLESGEVYLIPRADGRILVGATVEDVGFQKGATADGVRTLLDRALAILPGLGRASIEELWSGLRPGTPDGRPMLGAWEEVEGLFVATGHFRNGILLAPLTGRAMGARIAGEDGPAIPEAFAPQRFHAGSAAGPPG